MLDQAGVSLRGLDKDQYKVALEVNQTIWDGGQSQADRRVIEATADEHRQATEVDLYAVKGRVNDLYFGILLLEERLGQTDLTIALLQSNLDKVRSLVTNGVAMQTDADAVEAELLSVQQQRVQIEASRESYRRMLELFIGQTVGGAIGASRAGGGDFGRVCSSGVGLDRCAAGAVGGAGVVGKIGHTSPFWCLCTGILWLSRAGLFCRYGIDRLDLECLDRGEDVLEFRSLLYEEKQAF